MLRHSLWLLPIAASIAACSGAAYPPGQVTLSTDVAARMSRGVFELVVPAAEDGGATYTTPLPYALLPFRLRNQKFLPLGTAFAVSPTRFVTAAHVLLAARRGAVYLRGADGQTYEVSQILKLSQRKDVALFEVAGAPPGVVPLQIRSWVALGEPVLTVGTAGGEGIVSRGGVLASLTPEEVSGEWRFLRFTAPASPGNSGGPLVDSSGRVVGVVVRKYPVTELNAAVPIEELEKLGATQADFSTLGIPISEDLHEMRFDWKFTARLPSSLPALDEAAGRSFSESRVRWYSEFDAKFGGDVFPNHPRLRELLQEPDVPMGFGAFRIDGNGTWSTIHATYASIEVAPGQMAHGATSVDKTSGELLLDRPKGTPLATFFDSPTTLVDTIAHSNGWTIPFAGQSIRIASLGPPAENERWEDEYGRPWFTYAWRLDRSGESVLVSCLPNPAGWACFWKRLPASMEDAERFQEKRLVRRMTFTYFGLVREWIEFLALPETYKPRVFRDAHVRFDDGLSLKLGPMVAEHLSLPSLSADSSLYARVTLDPSSLHEERIYEVMVNPRVEDTYSFGVEEIRAPPPDSPEFQRKRWANLENGRAPFDDLPTIEGKWSSMKWGVKGTGKPDRMYLEFCRSRADDSLRDVRATCSKFREGLRVGLR